MNKIKHLKLGSLEVKEKKIISKLIVTRYYKCPKCSYVNLEEWVTEIHFVRWHTDYKLSLEYRDSKGRIVQHD